MLVQPFIVPLLYQWCISYVLYFDYLVFYNRMRVLYACPEMLHFRFFSEWAAASLYHLQNPAEQRGEQQTSLFFALGILGLVQGRSYYWCIYRQESSLDLLAYLQKSCDFLIRLQPSCSPQMSPLILRFRYCLDCSLPIALLQLIPLGPEMQSVSGLKIKEKAIIIFQDVLA